MLKKLSTRPGLQLVLLCAFCNIAWIGISNGEREILTESTLLLSPSPNSSYAIASTIPFLLRGSNPQVERVAIFVDGEFVTFSPRDEVGDFSFSIGGLLEGQHTIGYSAHRADNSILESSAALVHVGGDPTGPYEVYGGRVTIESEEYDSQTSRGEDFWVKRAVFSGFSSSGYMETIEDNGTRILDGYSVSSSELKYQLYFPNPGRYYLWYRGYGTASSQNSVHFGIEGQELPNLRDVGFSRYNQWVWTNENGVGEAATFTIAQAGEYEVNLWMREDGTKVDKFVISDDPNFQPSGQGSRLDGRQSEGFIFSASMLLSGAVSGNSMRTELVAQNLVPARSSPNLDFQIILQEDFFEHNEDIVDWVEVECRSQLNVPQIENRIPALLTRSGDIVNPDGSRILVCPNARSEAYFVVLDHRNHLEVITANRVLKSSGILPFLDFINMPDLARSQLGPALRQTDIGYALWGGDVNDDEIVSYAGSNNDRVRILEEAGGPTAFDFAEGYLAGDLNLDGIARYAGSLNDRVVVLESSGPTSFDARSSQLP